MSVNPETTCAPGQIQQILEAVKQAHREMGIAFTEERGAILAPLALKNMGTQMVTWVDPKGLCVLILPIERNIDPRYRQAAGEFLHRMNVDETQKLWEIDFNNGNVSLTACTDSLAITLDTQRYKELFNLITTTGETVVPYLYDVHSRKTPPAFAADQACAALAVALNLPPEDFEDDDED